MTHRQYAGTHRRFVVADILRDARETLIGSMRRPAGRHRRRPLVRPRSSAWSGALLTVGTVLSVVVAMMWLLDM